MLTQTLFDAAFVKQLQPSAAEIVLDPVVADWVDRVVVNGGNNPSNGTKIAMNTFYLALVNEG